ncbi:hypothetical protein ACFU5O_18015 [Streptomyces sp. NPDC057445]|uniref:hypothetical protein n=1 Tax=Streptomyces sp. NPDC057445 TaxID=3346136 RepID=UPI003675AD6F
MTMWKRAFGLAAAGLAAVVLASSPAAAYPNWQTVDTNANWTCQGYQSHVGSHNINFKGCVVRNAAGESQPVLVVQNKAGVAINIKAELKVWPKSAPHHDPDAANGSVFRCDPSPLQPGFTRGCFGRTDANWRATLIFYFNGIADSTSVSS